MLKDTVFLHRENIKQILLYVFSSYFFTDNFPKKIHPKCAPDRSISISKMQKLLRLGGGTPPSPLPPLGRFAPSLAFSLQYCKSYPPLTGNFFAPPDNRHLLRPCPWMDHILHLECIWDWYFLAAHTHALCIGSGSATGFFFPAPRFVHSLLKYFFKFQLWYWIQLYTPKYLNLILVFRY